MSEGAIGFATRLLELVQRGGKTASYKYALLVALIELALEARGQGVLGSAMFTTRAIAERMLALYWPQTGRYALGEQVFAPLEQMGGGRRSLVDRIAELRALDERETSTPNRARLAFPSEYRELLDQIEIVLIRYPLRLLQRLDAEHVDLIYQPWNQEFAESVIRRYQRQFADGGLASDSPPRAADSDSPPRAADSDSPPRAADSDFDNRVILFPGVHGWLAELAPLLLPLIRREWARLVAQRNRLPEAELETFLFAPKREQLGELRPELERMQDQQCFYCRNPLDRASQVDHFLAWSRCGASSIENLVVAHQACNNDKSDYLVAARHLERWGQRLGERRDDLAELAYAHRWPSEPARVRALVRSSYAELAGETRLWLARKSWVRAGEQPIAALLRAWPRG